MTNMNNPEPTNADVLAAVRELGGIVTTRFDAVDARFTKADARFDRLDREVGKIRIDMSQVHCELVAIKTDTAYCEQYLSDLVAAVQRHIEDTNAHRPAA